MLKEALDDYVAFTQNLRIALGIHPLDLPFDVNGKDLAKAGVLVWLIEVPLVYGIVVLGAGWRESKECRGA